MSKDSFDSITTHIAELKDSAHHIKMMVEPVLDEMFIIKILLTLPTSFDHFGSVWSSTAEAQRTQMNLISRLTLEEVRHMQLHLSGNLLSRIRLLGAKM